jgi:hypothetical protein
VNRIPGRGRCSRTNPSRAHQFVGSVLSDFDQNVCAKPRVRLVLLRTFNPERLLIRLRLSLNDFVYEFHRGEVPGWLTKKESQVTQSKIVYAYIFRSIRIDCQIKLLGYDIVDKPSKVLYAYTIYGL